MCKLKGGMGKGGHYDVEIKGWMQKGAMFFFFFFFFFFFLKGTVAIAKASLLS